jgi:hypothetical protein
MDMQLPVTIFESQLDSMILEQLIIELDKLFQNHDEDQIILHVENLRINYASLVTLRYLVARLPFKLWNSDFIRITKIRDYVKFDDAYGFYLPLGKGKIHYTTDYPFDYGDIIQVNNIIQFTRPGYKSIMGMPFYFHGDYYLISFVNSGPEERHVYGPMTITPHNLDFDGEFVEH